MELIPWLCPSNGRTNCRLCCLMNWAPYTNLFDILQYQTATWIIHLLPSLLFSNEASWHFHLALVFTIVYQCSEEIRNLIRRYQRIHFTSNSASPFRPYVLSHCQLLCSDPFYSLSLSTLQRRSREDWKYRLVNDVGSYGEVSNASN